MVSGILPWTGPKSRLITVEVPKEPHFTFQSPAREAWDPQEPWWRPKEPRSSHLRSLLRVKNSRSLERGWFYTRYLYTCNGEGKISLNERLEFAEYGTMHWKLPADPIVAGWKVYFMPCLTIFSGFHDPHFTEKIPHANCASSSLRAVLWVSV